MRVLNTSSHDLAFWIRSARSDAFLTRLRRSHKAKRAFDLLYRSRPDPWGAEMRPNGYQSRKYDALIRHLPERHFGRVLDVGCGLGPLTRRLAAHADDVLGVDLSQVAVREARARSDDYANVRYEQADLLALAPTLDAQFDLVVMADTLYYLSPLTGELLQRVAARVARLLRPDGLCLLANHFFFRFDPNSRTTTRIHAAFREDPKLRLRRQRRHAFFLVALLERAA